MYKIIGPVFFEETNSFRYVLIIPTSFFRQLRSPRSQDLNPCDYYPWLTLKDRVNVKYQHALQEQTRNTRRNCQYFNTTVPSCANKYLQKIQGPISKPEVGILRLFLGYRKLNSTGKTDYIASQWRQASYAIMLLRQLPC